MMRTGASRAAAMVASFVLATLVSASQPAANVVVSEARMEPLEQRRSVTGEIRAARRALLAAEAAGLVLEVTPKEGDRVASGDVVARLDATLTELEVRETAAQVDVQKALVSEREALLSEARLDLRRVRQLRDRGAVTDSELDGAETEVASAEARLAQAKAGLEVAEARHDLAKERHENMTIRAPFKGRIVSRRTEVGQWIALGDPVVELVAQETVEAWLDVPERFAGRLRESEASVTLRISATGAELKAPITSMIPDADPVSRMFPVRIVLDNGEELLKPGMSVIGMVPTGERRPMLTVPKDAVLRDDAGEFVYFVGGGRAAVARIETVFGVGDRVAIRQGTLPPGAQVIVEGNERLFPGQPLQVMNGKDQGPAGGPSAARGEGRESG